MLTNLLLIDIETVPQCKCFSELDPAWQLLFREKISKTVPEGADMPEIYRKNAGILAEFGKIICISTAYFHTGEDGRKALKIKNIQGYDEVEVLRVFTEICDQMYRHNRYFQFAGHNIKEFDIPYICRRMIINRLPLPVYLQFHDKKPWELRMFDTLNWWKFGDQKNYISLHLLATVLGLPTSKDDMDGSMVQDVFYKQQDLQRISDYCSRDVAVTAKIILRFLNQPLPGDDPLEITTV